MPASCDMAAGSSGGAWLFDGEFVSGVTSYSYQGRPTQLFSPYFGAADRRLPAATAVSVPVTLAVLSGKRRQKEGER